MVSFRGIFLIRSLLSPAALLVPPSPSPSSSPSPPFSSLAPSHSPPPHAPACSWVYLKLFDIYGIVVGWKWQITCLALCSMTISLKSPWFLLQRSPRQKQTSMTSPSLYEKKKNTIGNYEGFLCQTNINFVQWPAAGNHIRRKKWFIKSWWLSKKRRSYITIFWPFFTYEEILLVVWDSNPNFILGCEPSFCLRVVWDLHSNFRTGRDAPFLCKKRVPLHVEIIVKRIRHRCESVG